MVKIGNPQNTHSQKVIVKIIMKEPHPSLKITMMPLNEVNYVLWAKSATCYLWGKSKLGYMNGKFVTYLKDNLGYVELEANDQTVKLWLPNSMELTIVKGFLFLDYAKEFHDALVESMGRSKLGMGMSTLPKIVVLIVNEQSLQLH
ncbi:hypothetical protein EJ110_NYTH44044 [Nymphaea thermarum]|nr:hypothetical protein EJ110_NYTH44044 [Nymphaea thermarum]